MKTYRNKTTGEEIKAKKRDDRVFEVIDPNCPLQKAFGYIGIVGEKNFNENFEEVTND